MLSEFFLLIAVQTAPVGSTGVCLKDVGAIATAERLAQLPSEIQEDLKLISHNSMGDSDGPLLNTDSPSDRESKFPTARFLLGVQVKDKWYIQFEQAMSGVRTIGYRRDNMGKFYRAPWQYLGGPACETLRAMVSGVLGFGNVSF
ncbi:hypothetical protein ACG3SL_17570 [Sphingomonas sp. CJ20]